MELRKRNMAKARKIVHRVVATATIASVISAPVMPAYAQSVASQSGQNAGTTTPITHIILIIGENRTFDHVYGTYKPHRGERVNNLLSQGIVNEDGTPGPNFSQASQYKFHDGKTFNMSPRTKTSYVHLPPSLTDGSPTKADDANPPPFASVAAVAALESQIHDGLNPEDYPLLTTGASGLPSGSVDTRIPNAANPANGPYQITGPNMPYDAYTASPVHRFYQMWQQTDCSVTHATSDNPSGCLNDLFPYVEVTIGAGSNGKPQPANFTDLTTGEGSTSMGFYNMAQGDAPTFKAWADQYTMSDNFHQSIEGGTGANHIVIGTGLGMYYSDGQGHIATPPENEIENPTPQPGTNNWYTQDGYSGGSYSNCSDPSQPGVSAVTKYLASLPYKPDTKCEPGAYYLLNNYNPGYLGDGTVNTSTFTIPPSSQPTIGDVMNSHNISWRYYGAGWDNYVKDPSSDVGGIYCNICNPFQYSTQIMTNADQRQKHISDVPELYSDIQNDKLPAVTIVKPDGLLDGHPASSKLSLFEAFTSNIVQAVQANQKLWAHTAILVTFDEGGGYWDSGYIQPLDFFGDGTRIPAVMISPYSKGGHVSHVYADHVSFLKFVEKNWVLPTISSNGRDNLPNPVSYARNPYVPVNSPAIGDLMDMFDFTAKPHG